MPRSIIEEFFKNQYSVGQRFTMLNALALGARELASLPTPPSITDHNRTSFPSKILPTALHRKYLAVGNQSTDLVQHLLEGISHKAINRGKEGNVDKVPNLVRERHLRMREPARISEVHSGTDASVLTSQMFRHQTTFTDVAAEFFIAPLINRFWLFLRNEQTRETRTAHQKPLYRYKGAGTSLILNPMVLTHFLSTLAVLVHAAQNAPQWLAVVAPDALELAVTIGTRPVSQMEDNEDETDRQDGQAKDKKEASVLTAALELVLVVLDGSLELDDGRSLGLEHTALMLGAGEWAGEVFSRLEKGALVEGGGGVQEVKLKRSAAGVLLQVDEVITRWRRSMVDVR
jgi:telomere length regulation protein